MYAFIASERSGDLFIYDVTNPFQVAFVSHNNNRDFDLEFELDGNEVSSTVSVYQIKEL